MIRMGACEANWRRTPGVRRRRGARRARIEWRLLRPKHVPKVVVTRVPGAAVARGERPRAATVSKRGLFAMFAPFEERRTKSRPVRPTPVMPGAVDDRGGPRRRLDSRRAGRPAAAIGGVGGV